MVNFAMWFQLFHSQHLKTDNNSIHTDGIRCTPVTGDAKMVNFPFKAPEIYISEITNMARKYNKLADFTHEELLNLAEDGINLVDQFIVKDIWKESLR